VDTPSKKVVWTGRVLSILVSLMFLVSAFFKFKGGPELAQGMGHLGLPESMVIPLAILELTVTVVYLIPQTAVLGAVLLTGYIGGALCTHWRVGDSFIVHIVLGLVMWLGLYLREPRLKALLPIRTPPAL
jgi:hypothetical protein